MKWTEIIICLTLAGIIIYAGIAYLVYVYRESAWVLGIKGFVQSYGFAGIFSLTIVAGTFFPLGSPGIVAMGAGFGLPALPLAAVAASGYTLGVVVDYSLGYLGRPWAERKLKGKRLVDLTRWWSGHGWTLCVAFGLVPGLPLDLLAILCGFLKMRLRLLMIISFFTLLVQFTLFAYFGEYIGGLIGI